MPAPVPGCARVPVVATTLSGRNSTMRPISDDENSRSPVLVLKVIFSGDVPLMS